MIPGEPSMTARPASTPSETRTKALAGRNSPAVYARRVGSGDTLVLLHGLGESHVGWRPVIDMLAENYDVIAIDLPGFGRSPSLPAHVPPTAGNLAQAVEVALDELGVGEFHVAGYSLGARIALELGRSSRAMSVIAMGPDGLGTPLERIQGYLGLATGRGVAIALAPAAAPLSMTPVGRMVFFAGNRSFPWQLPAADARQLLTGFAAAPGYDAANWAGMFDLPTHLHTVTQPVLFLQGTNDPITGQVLRYLPLLPHAELRLLPGLNHVPISDAPDVIVGHMHEFLQKVTD
jgi:pimeloyl-ACP methyl ester carboxylesterase